MTRFWDGQTDGRTVTALLDLLSPLAMQVKKCAIFVYLFMVCTFLHNIIRLKGDYHKNEPCFMP